MMMTILASKAALEGFLAVFEAVGVVAALGG